MKELQENIAAGDPWHLLQILYRNKKQASCYSKFPINHYNKDNRNFLQPTWISLMTCLQLRCSSKLAW